MIPRIPMTPNRYSQTKIFFMGEPQNTGVRNVLRGSKDLPQTLTFVGLL